MTFLNETSVFPPKKKKKEEQKNLGAQQSGPSGWREREMNGTEGPLECSGYFGGGFSHSTCVA